MSAPAIFRESRGLFYPKLDTTGAGLIPVAKLKTVAGGPINLVFWDPRDPHASLAYRDQLSTQITVGMFTDPHWYAGAFPSNRKDLNGRALPDPLLYRRQVSSDVARLHRTDDPVLLDFEKIPRDWHQLFLIGAPDQAMAGWVGKAGVWWNGGTNMLRPTAFSNEPHQDNPTDLYAKAKAAYLAQLYDGAMNDRPAWQEAQWEEADGQNLADALPIYDAADYDPADLVLGSYLFDANRLTHLFT
jgi:hypothetical protein